MPMILNLLPTDAHGRFVSVSAGLTSLAFTKPERSRLYMGILNLLQDGVSRTINEIFSALGRTQKHSTTFKCFNNRGELFGKMRVRRWWSSASILYCLTNAGYLQLRREGKRQLYSVTNLGRLYFKAVTEC